MTALTFHQVQGSEECCHEPSCSRSARYTMLLCGYPIPSDTYTKNPRVLLCRNHKKEYEGLYAELSESAPSKAIEQAIGALRGSESERVRAVWQLRGYGFSAAQITAEVRNVALEREGVAA